MKLTKTRAFQQQKTVFAKRCRTNHQKTKGDPWIKLILFLKKPNQIVPKGRGLTNKFSRNDSELHPPQKEKVST